MEIGAASQMLVTGDRLHLQCRLATLKVSAVSFSCCQQWSISRFNFRPSQASRSWRKV